MQAVTFDMDGLIFNSEDVYTLAGTELLSRRGCQFTPELKDAMMGLPPQKAIEAMIDHHALTEPWQSIAAESNAIFLGLLDRHLATMPGLMELLDAWTAPRFPRRLPPAARGG